MIDRDGEVQEHSKEEELKRADHLIYVTLKYTRTVDVMRNIIKRLISAIDFTVYESLVRLKVKPHAIAQVRFTQLEKKIKGLEKYRKFYLLMKKIDKSKFSGREEYRKNVTLLVGKMEITVDILKEYFAKTKEFISVVS